MPVSRVIAVDVASTDDRAPMTYGDTLSGWYLLYNYLMRKPFRAPSIADIQSKLAYVSCVRHMDKVIKMKGCEYVRPNVAAWETLAFGEYKGIIEEGYRWYANVATWLGSVG